MQTWSDPRPYQLQKEVLPSLEEAARSRSIQGLISTTYDSIHTQWLHSLPVPITSFTDLLLRSGVDLDYESFLEVALKSLKEQGCRSVALLVPLFDRDPFGRFGAMAERQGMNPHEVWRAPWAIRRKDPLLQTDPAEKIEGADLEWTGFEGFKKFWHERPHPDGLIVYPETVARGALMGLLTERVQVPEELRVVLHKHEEMNYLCPLPVTYGVSRVRELAEEMLQQLDLVLKGYETEVAFVKFHASAY